MMSGSASRVRVAPPCFPAAGPLLPLPYTSYPDLLHFFPPRSPPPGDPRTAEREGEQPGEKDSFSSSGREAVGTKWRDIFWFLGTDCCHWGRALSGRSILADAPGLSRRGAGARAARVPGVHPCHNHTPKPHSTKSRRNTTKRP